MECEVVYEGLALRGWEGELETGAGISEGAGLESDGASWRFLYHT